MTVDQMKWLKNTDLNTLSSTEWIYLAGKWEGKHKHFIFGLIVGIILGGFAGFGFAYYLDITDHFMKINDFFLLKFRNCLPGG